MSDTDNVINEFLIETHENLDHVDRDLLALERDPSAGEPLAHVFRVIHTIKGTCGFLGFSKLGSLSHAAESLLSRVRDGQMRLTPEITRTLLSVVDAIRQILSTIETSRGEGTTDCSALIATLGQLVETAAGQATPPASPPVSPTSKSAGAPERASGPPVCEPIGDILIRTGRVKARDVLAAAHEQHRGDPRHIGEILVERGAVQPRDVVEALRVQREARGASLADNSIRVDVAVLDRLMNLVGELVLVRNEMLELTANRQNVGFVAASQRLDLITTELQEGIMKTRMQPIACVWSKLPRLVHDLAAAFGKQLRIEMEGQETELDKSILEAIKDPLIHIVRNSVDHGIEIPKARTERGKPAEGRLLLRAFHEGGKVNLEIHDDGAGIDPERIRQKAIRNGVVSAEHAGRMSDRELVNLIFLPGFSTAEMITKVSGRGVGMDVVKTNIERIGGAIDVQSRPGQGTSIHVKIPLTLAIIPALIVRCRGDRFCIAQAGVVELVRISPERARDAIERVHDAPVYRLREQLLPVVRLGPALGLGDAPDSADHPLNIVVVRADGARFALVVDEVHDSEEIVVKPLGEQLAHLSVYAGATIMGDGRIALILDVPGLAQHAGIVRDEHAPRAAAAPTPAPAPAREFGELLVCSIAAGRRIAIPLTSVARLEELPASAIERTGGHEVVQHRGRVIPLVRLSAVLGGCAVQDPAATDRVHTVICSGATGDAALAVDAVLEIVRDAATVAGGPTAPGIAGCALIHGRVTDLVDVRALIRRASGGEHGRPTAA